MLPFCSMLNGYAAGDDGYHKHYKGNQEGQVNGLFLMLAKVHPGQAHQQEGGGGQRGDGEAGGHLTQDSGAAHGQGGDAKALGGFSQHGQHAVIEGVRVKEQGGGHSNDINSSISSPPR